MKTYLSWVNNIMIAAIAFAFFAGCGTTKIASNRLSNDFVANGSDDDWTSTPQYYDEKKNVAIRVSNDDDSIYLCFSASSEEVTRQLAMSGLTVWLDPEGGEKKRYGVRLEGKKPPRRQPPGMSQEKAPEREHGPQDKPCGFEASNKPLGFEASEQPPRFEASEKIGIILPGDPAPIEMKAAEAEKLGVEFAGQCDKARAVFEFKIRIYGRNSAFEMSPLEELGIGLVAGMSRDSKRPDRSGSPGRGPGGPGGPGLIEGGPSELGFGPGGGMGGGPPGGFGEKGPGGGKFEKPYEVWLNVKLAP